MVKKDPKTIEGGEAAGRRSCINEFLAFRIHHLVVGFVQFFLASRKRLAGWDPLRNGSCFRVQSGANLRITICPTDFESPRYVPPSVQLAQEGVLRESLWMCFKSVGKRQKPLGHAIRLVREYVRFISREVQNGRNLPQIPSNTLLKSKEP